MYTRSPATAVLQTTGVRHFGEKRQPKHQLNFPKTRPALSWALARSEESGNSLAARYLLNLHSAKKPPRSPNGKKWRCLVVFAAAIFDLVLTNSWASGISPVFIK